MSFQLVQTAIIPANQNTNVLTFNKPIGPGNMVVGFNGGFNTSVSTLSDDKGNNYVINASTAPYANAFYEQLFYLTNIQFSPSVLTFGMTAGNPGSVLAAEFTPSGFFDKMIAQGGSSNPSTASGVETTGSLAPNQPNCLLVALLSGDSFGPNVNNPGGNPVSGGNWTTALKDVSGNPPITASGSGPVNLVQYQIYPTGPAQGVGTGFLASNVFCSSIIASFAPAPLFVATGQICVG